MAALSDRLAAPGAVVERLVSGLQFTEGPVWIDETQSLVFSDIRANKLYQINSSGALKDIRNPSNFANGNTLDNQGRLITCEHATSRVIRQEADGKLTVLASHWLDCELNSPNDVIVDRFGAIWFTDPTYGRMSAYGVERRQALNFQGVFRISPDGELHLIADDFDQPNGLCLSNNEQSLFVSDTRRYHIRRFDITQPRKVLGGDVFAETKGDGVGCPDGLKFDGCERLFSCGPGGIQVFATDGTLLGVLSFPEEATNFTWGDEDLRTLFVTAQTSVYRLRMAVPGRPTSRSFRILK